MSQWHRENPELAGTSADPWMSNPGHAAAFTSLVREGHVDAPDSPEWDCICGGERDPACPQHGTASGYEEPRP